MRIDKELIAKVRQQITETPGGAIDLCGVELANEATMSQILELLVEHLPQLTELTLKFATLRDEEAFQQFLVTASRLRLSDLSGVLALVKKLDFSGLLRDHYGLYADATDSIVQLLVDAVKGGNLPNLRHIVLSYTCLRDAGLSVLADAVQTGYFAELQGLCLQKTQITDASVQLIAQAIRDGHLPSLRDLLLSNTKTTDKSVEPILDAIAAGEMTQLEGLALGMTYITGHSVKAIARAALSGNLAHLELLELSYLDGWYATIYRHADVAEGMRILAEATLAGQFFKLRALYIAGTSVTKEVAGLFAKSALIGRLTHLQQLDLARNNVTDAEVKVFAEAALGGHLSQLEELYLDGTNITDVSMDCLAKAEEAGHLRRLRKLFLDPQNVVVPKEILNGSEPRAIFQWYRDRKSAAEPLAEMKLLVLGEAGVGKTALCRRMFGGNSYDNPIEFAPIRVATHDFDMHEIELSPELPMCEPFKSIKVRLWDFGGESQLHGSHRFFVGAERAFYLLVLDASASSQQNRLAYWLRFISTHSCSNSAKMNRETQLRAPVVIVLTKCDKLASAMAGRCANAVEIEQNHKELLADLTSARELNYFGANVIAVIEGCGWFAHESECELLPSEMRNGVEKRHRYACIRLQEVISENLSNVLQLNANVPPAERKIRDWVTENFEFPTSSVAETRSYALSQFNYDDGIFHEWCLEHHLDREQSGSPSDPKVLENRIRNALRVLKGVGLVHWIGDVLEERGEKDHELWTRVFNPYWLKTPVYRVLRAAQIDDRKGWITSDQLEKLLPVFDGKEDRSSAPETVEEWFRRHGFTAENRRHIVDLMQASGLLYEVKTGGKRHGWLIPDRLVDNTRRPKIDSEPDAYLHVWALPFLPDRVLLRFLANQLVRRFGDWETISEQRLQQLLQGIYRNHVRLPWPENGVEYVVELQTEVCPPINQQPWISLSVSGGDGNGRRQVFQHVFFRLNEILEDEELNLLSEPVNEIKGSSANPYTDSEYSELDVVRDSSAGEIGSRYSRQDQSNRQSAIPIRQVTPTDDEPGDLRSILEGLPGAMRRDVGSYFFMVNAGPCDAKSGPQKVYSEMVDLLEDHTSDNYREVRETLIVLFSEHRLDGEPDEVELEPGRKLKIPNLDTWRRNLNHAVKKYAPNSMVFKFLMKHGLGKGHGKRGKRGKPWECPKDFRRSQDTGE